MIIQCYQVFKCLFFFFLFLSLHFIDGMKTQGGMLLNIDERKNIISKLKYPAKRSHLHVFKQQKHRRVKKQNTSKCSESVKALFLIFDSFSCLTTIWLRCRGRCTSFLGSNIKRTISSNGMKRKGFNTFI